MSVKNTPKNSSKKNVGYIAVYRKLRDNPIWQEPRVFSKAEAWIDVLMEVRFSERPQKVVIGMHTLTCNYAESLNSLDTWAVRWGWTRNKVWRFFKFLEGETMIVTESERLTTRLRVCNYRRYDIKQNANRTQIERKQKQKNNEEERIKYSCNSDEFQLAKILLDLILQRKSNFKQSSLNSERKKNAFLQGWAVFIDRLIRLDGRTPEQIEAVIRWCQADEGDGKGWGGWQNNILSTRKLRGQFDQLELKMNRSRKESQLRTVKFESDGPSAEFIKNQLDSLLAIPEPERTARDREDIQGLQAEYKRKVKNGATAGISAG